MPNQQDPVCIPDSYLLPTEGMFTDTSEASAVAFLNETNQLHCHDRVKQVATGLRAVHRAQGSLPQTARHPMGPTQTPIQWVPGGFSALEVSGRRVNLTAHLHLVPRLRASGGLPLLPPTRLYYVPRETFTRAFHTALSPVSTHRAAILLSITYLETRS
jgi:hypothetical protein